MEPTTHHWYFGWFDHWTQGNPLVLGFSINTRKVSSSTFEKVWNSEGGICGVEYLRLDVDHSPHHILKTLQLQDWIFLQFSKLYIDQM